ncbi:MAG: DUF423 domain-containing protein [Alphaproteobacteria bacterium]|nr:DUF423 domain-containing protein [Alphaproteobacteria bacterium]
MHRIWLVSGAVLAFAALAFAAFTQHALGDNYLPMMRMILDTAREVQFVHALALIAVGILVMQPGKHPFLNLAGGAFLIGIILFCGGLDTSADPTGRFDALKPVIPVGGFILFVGWTLFAFGALTLKKPQA